MIGLDTNVLVRYFAEDDAAQCARAVRFIESRCTVQTPGCISTVTLVELVWVLTAGYEYAKSDVLHLLEAILETSVFHVQEVDCVKAAIERYCNGKADFADYLIGELNRRDGAHTVYTFDKRLARETGFALL